MELIHIIILVDTGIFAGFAGGLLGLGGAFIMTPVQFIVFSNMGLSPDMAIKTAFGTSLLVVLTTAISGAWRHHRLKTVRWRMACIMGSCSLIFAFLGATLATYIPGVALKITFGVISLLSCFRMLASIREKTESEPVNNPWVWALWSIPVGLLAGLLGVGGGVLMIPVMVIALKLKMHDAVANSLAVMIFTSIGGIIGYVVNGMGIIGNLSYSIGYINLPTWLLLAIPGSIMVQAGAITAHKLPREPLTFIFVIILFYMGLRMIGVFDWLGWPI